MNLVGVQEVRWEVIVTLKLDKYTLLYGEGNANHRLGTGCFVHIRISSAFKKVEFTSDSVSSLTIKGRWCDTVVNVRAPSEDSFYKEIERLLHQFPVHHIKILLGNFNSKVGRENIFQPH
jgi:hypothetical protein